MVYANLKLVLLSCLFYSFLSISLQFNPSDEYLIDCGSSKNTSVQGRIFVTDSSDSTSTLLSTHSHIVVNFTTTSQNLSSSTTSYASNLYQSARILYGSSHYTFPISKPGRHWVRLYFYAFAVGHYNLSEAKFSVSCQNFTLLTSSHLEGGGPFLKEYSLNVTSDKLVLTFTPFSNSFAYLNALEVVSVPNELIPQNVRTVGLPDSSREIMAGQAMETVARVNMGNVTVYPQNDTLSRLWVQDEPYLKHQNLVQFVSNVDVVNYTNSEATEEIAPPLVYGTASKSNSEGDPNTRINMTWFFDVDPGFHYMVRFHFCDIVNSTLGKMIFAIYINSWTVEKHLDLSHQMSGVSASPYYLDVVVGMTSSIDNQLKVSIGPSQGDNVFLNALLNGLEIMKLNDTRSSLDPPDADISSDNAKWKIVLIAGLCAGALLLIIVISTVIFLICKRRMRELKNVGEDGSKCARHLIFPKAGYQIPLSCIQEATDNFSENLVIGVGGFGKVYKGVLRDEQKVAVKRGSPDSQQGLVEFRTELEMLSQFRHRHLVSLIGYCDEQAELIIVYEYMENGSLRNRLYGSDLPKLSWKQRLEICIGAARGLHYLHTSSAKAIIHRDVKSANILLDENLMAKVADFGISRAGPEIDKTHVSTAVKGSFGYLDPEYLLRQQLTEKSDVYSFGVVLSEVICGRPVIDPSRPKEEVNMVEWVIRWQRRGELEKIVDPCLSGQINPDCLRKFGETAGKCLAQCGLDRPSMGEVLWNLESALQLQIEGKALEQRGDVAIQIDVSRPLQANGSIGRMSSLGSMADLPDTSTTTAFSEMTKADRSS